jgi:Domain of Unknown Function (DUF1540)
MKQMSVEMSVVKRCDVGNCGYNKDQSCHAKAITIGDLANPGCDTFMDSERHIKEVKRMAGVGACKVSNCIHNEDFECAAESITVGLVGDLINCRTYHSRS